MTYPFRAGAANPMGSSRSRNDCVKVGGLIDPAEWRHYAAN